MNVTKIDYLEHTWNPLAMRCTRVSPACDNCWHLRMADRKAANPKLTNLERQASAGLISPVLMPNRLGEPLRLKKPQRIGVQFMGDLFHENVPDTLIDETFSGMALSMDQHTFLMLTKRPERALQYFMRDPGFFNGAIFHWRNDPQAWPLKNVWLGVTIENQEWADKRIPVLLQIPAAKRFVSYEPALGPVDFHRSSPWGTWINPKYGEQIGLDWIIAGGETGPKARVSHPDWFRQARDQAVAAGVPFWFKSWGEWVQCTADQDVWNNHLKEFQTIPANDAFERVGKKVAGHLLDGRTWEELPT